MCSPVRERVCIGMVSTCMLLQDLAGRVAAMKAAAKAETPDKEPEPVPQYDALLAEEVCTRLGRGPHLSRISCH